MYFFSCDTAVRLRFIGSSHVAQGGRIVLGISRLLSFIEKVESEPSGSFQERLGGSSSVGLKLSERVLTVRASPYDPAIIIKWLQGLPYTLCKRSKCTVSRRWPIA